jgi:integrase
MARHLLSAREVQTAGIGDHQDGDGLLLRVQQGVGDKVRASWVLRYTSPGGKRRELGLGGAVRLSIEAAGASLKQARKKADEARDLLDRRPPVDPLDARAAERAAALLAEVSKKAETKRQRTTLARVARAYHEQVVEPNRTARHAQEWIGSLERHMPHALWHKPIDAITAPVLLEALADLIAKSPETARRVRQRLEVIFDHAEFHRLCSGNPGRAIRRKLTEGKRGRTRNPFRALSYKEVPVFVAELRKVEGISARALEFGLLCAARSSEIRFARWPEIDFDSKTWTIPAERMKARESHTVHLSDRAIEILKGQRGISPKYVFSGVLDAGKPLNDTAMHDCLARLGMFNKSTVHGLCRASFATWAYEAAGAREEIVEACLAHKEADRVKAAYDRSQHHAARRRLLQAWADFCLGAKTISNVIEGDFRAAREVAA